MKSQKILLVEGVHPIAKETLEKEGHAVTLIPHSPKVSELKGFDILGIRSKTNLTPEILTEIKNIKAIGAFCIGTNQIDTTRANHLGIPVFNAPYSNTRSVAELVMAEMVMLARQLGDHNTRVHKGEWVKSAAGSFELRGKTLGVIGYGHIGSQVSVLAEAFGMKVLYFDILKKLPMGNAKAVFSMRELLHQSDFVTLHVPETPQTRDMFGAAEFEAMKKGSFLINASRGSVVVISDLVQSLNAKKIAGCAIDVFPEEPSSNKEKFISPLQGVSNVILTPHIGGSTEEAQYLIGVEVAESLLHYIDTGSTLGAVNFPQVNLARSPSTQRLLNVHKNEPGVLGEINGLVSKAGANITAQALSTDSKIGYLMMDLEIADGNTLASEVAALSRSIKTRVLI